MKIILIRMGNTCRNPMAEGLFRRLLTEHGIMDITCDSAGLSANPDEPVASNVVTACRELGVDLSAHCAKLLSQEILQSANLSVVIMQSHAGVLKLSGVSWEKIKVLDDGVGGPSGGSIAIYRAGRDQIQKTLEELSCELGY